MAVKAAASRRRLRWALAVLLTGLAGATTLSFTSKGALHQVSLKQRLTTIHKLPHEQQVDCRSFTQAKPLVVLALGQSNAANHGPNPTGPAIPAVRVWHEGRCGWMQEPLAGATGRGANLWARVPSALAAVGLQRPVVIAVLAVDSTLAADWTDQGSPLRQRLQQTASGIKAAGLQPDLVLWQQGEADAHQQTAAHRYVEQLRALAAQLAQEGVHAPILLARSTVCRSGPNARLAQAIRDLIESDARFAAGPDTDSLTAPWARRDGCHFSSAGLDAAAQMWSEVIARQAVTNRQEAGSSASRLTPS